MKLQNIQAKLEERGEQDLVQAIAALSAPKTRGPITLTTFPRESADDVKEMLWDSLKDPIKTNVSYALTWNTPNKGLIILIKPEKGKAKVVHDDRGKMWLEDNIPSLFKNT